MTKDEMLEKYSPTKSKQNNYEEAQRRIKEAMEQGEKYVSLPREGFSNVWFATWDTIDKLREEGFHIDEMWQSYDSWSVEWGYEDYEFENAVKEREESERRFHESLDSLHRKLYPEQYQ